MNSHLGTRHGEPAYAMRWGGWWLVRPRDTALFAHDDREADGWPVGSEMPERFSFKTMEALDAESPTSHTPPPVECHCVDVEMGSHDNQVSMLNPFTNKWICVDTCIATYVGWLWHQGIETLNSCCGHGKVRPSVIVAPQRTEGANR